MRRRLAGTEQRDKGIVQIHLLCLLLLSTLRLATTASKLDFRFQNFGSNDGLSSDWVRSIIQDRQGYLWLVTDVGLDRYDGYSFVHFRHRPGDPSSISQERAFKVQETPQGNLWLYSSEGIDIFNPHEGRVLRHIPVARFGWPIWYMMKTRNNEMWLASWSGAKLFRLEGTSGRMLPLPAPLQKTDGYAVFEDFGGDLWIATRTGMQYGLSRYTPGSEHIVHYPAGEGGVIFMNRDKQGGSWFAYESGLDHFDPSTRSFRHYPFWGLPGIPFLGKSWIRFIADQEGRLWIGSELGLLLFDLKTRQFLKVRQPLNARGAPIFNWIEDLCEDSTGNVWFGTFADGLFKYNERFNRFHFIGYSPDPRSGLLDPHTVSIIEDRQGIIWITTWGGVLTRYDPCSGIFTHYQGAPYDPANDIPKRLYCPFEDNSMNLWLGSTTGLVRFDRSSGRFHHFPLRPERPGAEVINPGTTTTILREGPDGLVFSTMTEGLFHVNTARRTYTFQPHRELFPKGKKNHQVSSGAFQDRSGTLWFCTNNGLHSLDPRSGRISHFLADPARPGALLGDWVYHICEDRSGMLWVATRLGLNRMDRLRGTFKSYTERDGLRGPIVYWIIEDDDGFLWLSTNEGISRFDPRREAFRNYGPNEGVPIGRGFSACRSRDGKLYFTGTNGIVIFDPRLVSKTNIHVPPVVITNLRTDNRSIPIYKIFSQRDQAKQPGRVVMHPTDRVLSIEFAALDFIAPEKNRYAFRMEEQGEAWNELGTQHQITFSNLAVGTHSLRIKGSNNDGVWNETGVTLQIEVLPIFWQTWWFKLFALLGLSLLAIGLVHLRRRFVSLRRMADPPNLDEICSKHGISKREQEILRLVIQGKSNRDIENEFFISIRTVKRHIANIYEKFEVNSRLQLINFLRLRSVKTVSDHHTKD